LKEVINLVVFKSAHEERTYESICERTRASARGPVLGPSTCLNRTKTAILAVWKGAQNCSGSFGYHKCYTLEVTRLLRIGYPTRGSRDPAATSVKGISRGPDFCELPI
jgi:hypothetical protein